MNKQYSKKYYNKLTFKNNFSWFEKLFLKVSEKINIISNYYYILLKVLKEVPKDWTVLDVWLANWSFLNFIHRLRPDLKLYWIDITDTKDIIPEYITFIQADATNFDLKQKFDLVISNHLIEHLPVNSVPNMFKCIHNHIKNDWYFLLTVPSFSKSFFNDPTHIRPYNKESIKKLLEMINFENYKIYEEYYFRFPIKLFKFRNFKITFVYAKK